MNSKRLVLLAEAAAENKKAIDPLILDIRKLTDIADYFLLVHGTSDRHVRTIADGIEDRLYEEEERPLHVEGRNEARWILLDYGPVMIHVFHYQAREFYNLERLWGDAKILNTKKAHEGKTKRTRRPSIA